MRTTIDIDEDVLAAAKELAKAERKTMGQVISDLARQALTRPFDGGLAEAPSAFGVDTWPTFPDRGGPPVTNELVRKIQDQLDLEDATPYDHAKDGPRIFEDEPRTARNPRRT